MVKPYKASRSVAASDNCSGGSGSYKDSDQVYCVVLHVVEAINFVGRDSHERDREKIVMNASLNTVDFEVEGTQSSTAETIIFNSNCIWECDMPGIKRIKTDHRPVKVTFYACRGGASERKTIGSLLLPVRGLPVLSSAGSHNAAQLKMFWHKLICISSEFRSHKPEVLLILAIIKKSILHTKDFDHLMQFSDVSTESINCAFQSHNVVTSQSKSPPEPPMQSPGHSITSNMLQSQANVYVQSLVQLGLLQVGNDPLVDCDIIEVVLQLKQLKNVSKLARSLNSGKDPSSVILVFDFVGNVTNIELKLNESDSYVLNDVLGLRFKTSLRSMRLYFQRIFYLPINMYMNGTAIGSSLIWLLYIVPHPNMVYSLANYRMDFGKLLPPDSYFSDNRKFTCNGSFSFNRFGRTDSARDSKPPLMEYAFSVDVKTIFSRQETGAESEAAPSIRSGESEEENVLGKKFSSMVVREALPDKGQMEEASATSEDPPDMEMESQLDESEGDVLSRPETLETTAESLQGKNQKRKSSSMERPISQKGKPKMLNQPSKELPIDRSASTGRAKAPKTKTPLKDTDFIDDLTSLEHFELLEEQFKEEVDFELTDVRMRPRRIGGPVVPLERKVRKPTADVLHYENTDYIDSHLNIIYEEHSGDSIPKKLVRKKVVKKVSQRELGELETVSGRDGTISTRNSSTIKSQFDECDDSESAQPHTISSSMGNSSHPSKLAQETQESDVDTNDFQDGDVSSKRKKKSKMDLSLRARWVEVNKFQAQALDETEKFLVETCQAELNEVLYEDQLALGLPKPLKPKKKLVSSRKPKVVQSSELDSSFVEQEVPFSQADLLPKKKRAVAVEQEQVELQLDLQSSEEYISISEVTLTSSESIVEREPVTKKKLRKDALPENEMEINAGKPFKKKVVKKKASTSSAIAEIESNDVPEMEMPQLVKKKVIRKKSQRLVEEGREEDVVPTRKVSSKKLVRKESQEEPLEEEVVPTKRVSSKKLVSKESFEEPLEEEVVPKRKVSLKKLVRKESLEDPLELEVAPTRKVPLKKLARKDSQEELLEEEVDEIRKVSSTKFVRKEYHEEALEEEVFPTRKVSSKKFARKESPDDTLEEEVVPKRKVSSIRSVRKESTEEPVSEDVISARKVPSKKLAKKHSQEEHLEKEEVVQTRKVSSKKFVRPESKDSDQELSVTNDSVVQKLKSWRSQQIKQFEEDLACREQHYKSQLEEMECKEARMLKLGLPEEHLATAPPSVDYEAKFNELEHHISKLKAEMEQQLILFESRSQELRQENVQLATEKSELKARIATMEQQIGQLRSQGTDDGDIKQVLGELRSQNSRFLDLTREKDRYKKQWRRCAKKVHALKLTMYERNVNRDRDCLNIGAIDLKKILTKDALGFEQEYGSFRRSGQSPRFPVNSKSGSGDYSPPCGRRAPHCNPKS
ncbi:hypothetical protein KR074_000810 [Drosophila pseudoananassae]|nr:hypothetical protein KR074_000810 [Drosophila pseudoananassae]